MPLQPRPEIENLQTCYHGGPNYAELEQWGFKPEEVLDFSVSANPFGPPPEVKTTISSAVIDRYPDSNSIKLKRKLADRLGINPDQIIVGNGSLELIRTIAATYFNKDDTIIIPEPTFGEYELACQIAGSKVIKYELSEKIGFQLEVNDLVEMIQHLRPKAVFLCNPNNPTGQYLEKADVEAIQSACTESLLILDEAYVNFVEEPWDSMDMLNGENIIIVRSMTKDHALAGLRLGYAVADIEIISNLRKVCPSWNVNAVAQLAGLAVLENSSYFAQCRKNIFHAKKFIIKRLAHLGLEVSPSQAHFFLLKVGNATQFRQRLLQHGIVVRDCTSFGLPAYIRIAPRTSPECEKLIQTLSEIQK